MNIRGLASRWVRPDSLAEATCQILLFAETFNTFCSHRAIADPSTVLSTSTLLLGLRNHLVSRDSWPEWVEFSSLLRKVDRLPPYDLALVDALTSLLLEPAIIDKESEPQWKLAGGPSRLPRTPLPARLTLMGCIITHEDDIYFTSRPISGFSPSHSARMRGLFLDQIIDPIAICHRVLTEAFPSKHPVERAEFLLQRSLRRAFGLTSFSDQDKYAMARVATRFNDLFYGSSSLRVEEVQGLRSATISSSLLVNELSVLLDEQKGGDSRSRAESLRHAVGIWLLARFCRVLRVRYFRLIDFALEPRPSALFLRDDLVGQCISAIRRLEYGYFLNRVFGSISEIPGLNFVFRGGILPRTETGRVIVLAGPPGSGKTVFALQKLCGVASRGGLAVYFSFEERLEILVDRLVTFGLLEQDRFDVVAGDEQTIKDLSAKKGGKGLLVLYTIGGKREYPLLDAIRDLAQLSSWRWRALVIDSINALHLVAKASTTSNAVAPSRDRVAARELVEQIEDNGYLGIIIAEESSARFEELEYIVDTVIRFGFNMGDRGRWLEIHKCRSQNFHSGRHKMRFIEGDGVSIIPSLGAIRSALRRRTKSTLSGERVIHVPGIEFARTKFGELAEKSSVLVVGNHGAGKTALLLRLATAPTRWRIKNQRRIADEARSVLFVTFKTTEERFMRALRSDSRSFKQWQRLRMAKVRWFSPGETITGDEVVWEIWQEIQKARRRSLGIERIVFDEIENAVIALPAIAKEPLFWTSLLQMTSAEAITTFLGLSLEHTSSNIGEIDLLHTLVSEADYVLKVVAGEPRDEPRSEREGEEGEARGEDQDQKDTEISIHVEKCPEEMRRGSRDVFPGSAESQFLAEEWEPMREQR